MCMLIYIYANHLLHIVSAPQIDLHNNYSYLSLYPIFEAKFSHQL